jgi:hypothetical protein
MAMHELDRQLADLKDRFPGWRVWYHSRTDDRTTWTAQPARYPLAASSAGELAALITADEEG